MFAKHGDPTTFILSSEKNLPLLERLIMTRADVNIKPGVHIWCFCLQ